jgi:hypothetical protein
MTLPVFLQKDQAFAASQTTSPMVISGVAPAAGSNRAAIVAVAWETSAAPLSVSSVTWAGAALTFLGRIRSGSSIEGAIELWYLKEAGYPAVSGDVSVSMATPPSNNQSIVITQYGSVDQDTTFGSLATAAYSSGTTVSGTVSSGLADALVLDFVVNGANVTTAFTVTPNSPQTVRANIDDGDFDFAAGETTAAAVGSYTTSWEAASVAYGAYAGVALYGLRYIQNVTNLNAESTATIAFADGYDSISSITANGVALSNITLVDANTVTAAVPKSIGVAPDTAVDVVVTDANGASLPFSATFGLPAGREWVPLAEPWDHIYSGSAASDIHVWETPVTHNGISYAVSFDAYGVVNWGGAPDDISTRCYIMDKSNSYVAGETQRLHAVWPVPAISARFKLDTTIAKITATASNISSPSLQLQVSIDGGAWTNSGTPVSATSAELQYDMSAATLGQVYEFRVNSGGVLSPVIKKTVGIEGGGVAAGIRRSLVRGRTLH